MTTAPGENVTVESRLAVLETQMEALQEGQRQIIARLDSMEQTNDARFDSMNLRINSINSRFDRLFYSILGLGVAAIGTMIALEKVF